MIEETERGVERESVVVTEIVTDLEDGRDHLHTVARVANTKPIRTLPAEATEKESEKSDTRIDAVEEQVEVTGNGTVIEEQGVTLAVMTDPHEETVSSLRTAEEVVAEVEETEISEPDKKDGAQVLQGSQRNLLQI